jgi:Tfp pilus assembly protein FimT
MADNKAVNLSGLMIVLAVIAVLTVGGVTGFSVVTWPGSSSGNANEQRDQQLEVLAKSVARLSAKGILDYEDAMERQFFLDKVVKDIKADFPEIKDVWVLDDKRMVVYSANEDEIEKPYKVPEGIKPDPGEKFTVQNLSANSVWVATPIISMKTIIGGLRMKIDIVPAKGGSGGGKGLLMIVGLIAMIIGIAVPVVMVSAKSKELASLAVATNTAAVSDARISALKAEENSIAAKLETAKRELAQADMIRSQQSGMAQQIEDMKKQQFEENYKLEALKKETADLAEHIEKRKKILEANPLERQAALSSEEKELAAKIAAHKQEEVKLAQKIELIRKKVVDLDRRIEKRQKEEQEIADRIEVRKKEEMALNQKMGG